MCGIIGYVGKREAAPILVEGLHRLEYRGYDSAGVAVQNGAGVVVTKLAGRVAALGELLGREPVHGTSGIAHTRWATHGAPTTRNAWPSGCARCRSSRARARAPGALPAPPRARRASSPPHRRRSAPRRPPSRSRGTPVDATLRPESAPLPAFPRIR